MTRILFVLALLMFAVPAYAQDAEPISKERLELAEKMHEIWPIRTRIERALDAVAASFPAERQAEIKATLRRSIQFDQLEEESIKAMAETFDEKELQAMINFYGSEEGRAVSVKTADYEMALKPIMVKMIDKAMMDLRLGTPK